MKKFAMTVLTAGALALLGAPASADDDDDDDDRRGKWRQRIEHSYWYPPRVYPPRYDGWDGRYERHDYEERFRYPQRGRYWSPGWPAPWEFAPWELDRPRGYWRGHPYDPYPRRYERPWRWSRGDDDDDDDDD